MVAPGVRTKSTEKLPSTRSVSRILRLAASRCSGSPLRLRSMWRRSGRLLNCGLFGGEFQQAHGLLDMVVEVVGDLSTKAIWSLDHRSTTHAWSDARRMTPSSNSDSRVGTRTIAMVCRRWLIRIVGSLSIAMGQGSSGKVLRKHSVSRSPAPSIRPPGQCAAGYW